MYYDEDFTVLGSGAWARGRSRRRTYRGVLVSRQGRQQVVSVT